MEHFGHDPLVAAQLPRLLPSPTDHGWALRVAKAICLLEFIRDLPRTDANLAAVLVDEVGKPTPVGEVQAATKRLNTAQFNCQLICQILGMLSGRPKRKYSQAKLGAQESAV